MQIPKQIDINVPAEKAWDVLQDIGSLDQWFSGVYESSASGNAKGESRLCETDFGQMKETMTVFDEEKMRLSYGAQGKKMPFFVKGLSNNWKVQPLSANSCRVMSRMECTISPFPFKVFPGPMMKMQFNKVLGYALEELKYYCENGKAHPRKIELQQKFENKQRKAA